jgi:hypothetical protein
MMKTDRNEKFSSIKKRLHEETPDYLLPKNTRIILRYNGQMI